MMAPRCDLRLYLVTDDAFLGPRAEEMILAAIEGGVTLVQLRWKSASGRALYEKAVRWRRWLHEREIGLIINDRLDVALAAGADGVHLGQEDLPCAEARRIAGPDFIIGISAGSPEEARRASADGATYVAASPVFATPTKPDAPPALGLKGVRAIRKAIEAPLVAIGGIHADNAADVIAAGGDGVAVVSAILAAPDPRAAAAALRHLVDETRAKVGPRHRQ